nr:unnamed protein product [Callosobruchus analis]
MYTFRQAEVRDGYSRACRETKAYLTESYYTQRKIRTEAVNRSILYTVYSKPTHTSKLKEKELVLVKQEEKVSN